MGCQMEMMTMTTTFNSYYRSAAIFTVIAAVLAFFLGGPATAGIVLLLGVLEVSLSFDNAVVNASILKNWQPLWRNRFLTWGLPVAVFGMRLAFPLAIVAIVAKIGPLGVIDMALHDPTQYATVLTSVHAEIAAFGGAFLMMVCTKFFLDAEKDKHWISFIEAPLAKLGQLEAIQIAITLLTIYTTSRFLAPAEQLSFVTAGIWGLLTYIGAEAVGGLVQGEEGDGDVTNQIVRQGVTGLLYLELLDASFSFDGVIGSFALSNFIFVIALGLGIGAMFVRSMTLHLVDKGTLNEYPYLEPAAFWAIAILAVIMFVGTLVDIPEIITGTIGGSCIALGLWSSILHNRKSVTITA
jgi:hypothetical protein